MLLRDREVRRAARIVCPSSFLAGLHARLGGRRRPNLRDPERGTAVSKLPDPVDGSENRVPLLAFTGRLTAPKALGVLLEAVAQAPGVQLELAGDGDERAALEARSHELGLNSHVTFLGPLPREEVLSLFRRADAVCLSSIWENFPHTLVEALADIEIPVIATRVGGVPEIVEDGENGLLVEPRDPEALAAAIRRVTGDADLRSRLAAAPSPCRRAVLGSERVRRARAGHRRRGRTMKPRVLIVGRSRYRLPLESNLKRKFDALAAELDVRVLASGSGADGTFRLVAHRAVLDGPRFWAALPGPRPARGPGFRPDAILVESPYEAAAVLLARVGRPGDPRSPRRLADRDPPLYGSSARRTSSRRLPTGSPPLPSGASTPSGRSRRTRPSLCGRVGRQSRRRPHKLGRVRRDRPDGVDAPDGSGGDPVGKRREETAGRRAVQRRVAVRQSPWTSRITGRPTRASRTAAAS